MGSRAPRRTQRCPDASAGDEAVSPSVPSGAPSPSALLRRIAGALQIPPAALYGPPDVVAPIRGGDGAHPVDLDRECLALLHAYTRIRDQGERHRILALAQEAAGRP